MSLSKILCIDDEEDIRELLILTLEASIEANFIEFPSGNKAINYLKENKDVDLVFCDFNMNDGNGKVVYDYMKSHHPQIPFAFISANSLNDMEIDKEEFFKNKADHHFKKPWDEDLLVEYIKKHIGKTREVNEYTGFRTELFFQLETSPVDIYISLSKEKYIKIINQNDSDYQSILEKYEKKNLKKFFVKSDDAKKILNFLSLTIFGKLSKSTCVGEEKVKAEKAGISLIQNFVLEMGIDETTQEMVDEVANSIKSKVTGSEKLSGLLGMLDSLGDDYETHSLLITYVSTILLKRLNLQSRSTIEKLCTAALLHDIFLEDYECITLHDYSKKNVTEFEYNERIKIKDHVVKCCDFIKASGALLSDVETIILQHHEKPDGSGYPKGLTGAHISPLSAVFILSEFLAIEIQKNQMKIPEKEKLLKDLESYNKGNFKKAYKELVDFINES